VAAISVSREAGDQIFLIYFLTYGITYIFRAIQCSKVAMSFMGCIFVTCPELLIPYSTPDVFRLNRNRYQLGSGLIEFQSQKMTVAARAMAERKTLGHRS
jgi:hypothetical protein